jgi:hypothetical protein
MQSNSEEDNITTTFYISSGDKGKLGFIIALVVVWALAGFAAFVMSLVCFGRSGSIAQHIVGLLLALIVGPFYWIYFAASNTYCKKM